MPSLQNPQVQGLCEKDKKISWEYMAHSVPGVRAAYTGEDSFTIISEDETG